MLHESEVGWCSPVSLCSFDSFFLALPWPVFFFLLVLLQNIGLVFSYPFLSPFVFIIIIFACFHLTFASFIWTV